MSTTVANINARQVNSDEAIRNRQQKPFSLIDSSTNEMLVDENGKVLVSRVGPQEGDI